ncbi:MAG: hypothetical protein HFH66_12740 [Lachnospiraceae bacterium]|nr:hypothetical protein [Lachnospiraceae bacterium]
MGFKYLKKTAVSITLLFAMVLNLTAIQPVNVFAMKYRKKQRPLYQWIKKKKQKTSLHNPIM